MVRGVAELRLRGPLVERARPVSAGPQFARARGCLAKSSFQTINREAQSSSERIRTRSELAHDQPKVSSCGASIVQGHVGGPELLHTNLGDHVEDAVEAKG